tara:strand:- start:423 stop:671 length:249 start_codon:yes stop_codon:yes gene_type:complete
VRATVIEYVDIAVFSSAQNHPLLADPSGPIVPCIGDLALMTDVNPGFVENVLEFFFENLFIRVTRFVDPVWFNQRSQITVFV